MRPKNIVPPGERMFIRRLKSSGYRITEPRQRVIDVLTQADSPMSAKEIFEDISKKIDEKVDVATIYRILERFSDLGICHQVGPNGKYVLCLHEEDNPETHVILRCTVCGEIVESATPKDVLSPLAWYIQTNQHFLIKKSMLQMDGICSKCGGL
jgi:Fe2+ or Zn2+ uptake regulation protein